MIDKRMPSIQQKNFAALPAPKPSRSRFDLSHDVKFDFNPAELIPVLSEMMIPGDTFRGRVQAFIRLATQKFPTMDNARVILEAFFIPYRLVWDNFQRAMGERFPDPDSSIDFVFPRFVNLVDENEEPFAWSLNSISDYIGDPVDVMIYPGDNLDYPSSPHCLIHRSYYKTWNDWYRSDSLQDRLVFPTDDGPDQYDHYKIQRRGKPADYFTTALPWPQRGDAIPLPLGESVPVVGNGMTMGLQTNDGMNTFRAGLIGYNDGVNGLFLDDSTLGDPIGTGQDNPGGPIGISYGLSTDPANSGLVALLNDASGATINTLRDYIVAQQMSETTARAGSLYRDQVKAIFGVTIPDFRLQRVEYVGGNRSVIGIHSVAQTAPTSGTNPQAGLAAYGTGLGELTYSYSAVEHGTLMIMLSVSTDLSYQNQLRRQRSIRTQYDIFRPEMAHLGEQAILNQEMWFSGVPGEGEADDQGIWGYQERWAEYRSIPSRVGGSFRSIATPSLDVWHWATDYDSLPELGDVWIEDDPPMDRSVAVQDQPLLLAWVSHSIDAARPIPVHSIPGLRRL